MQLSIQKLLLDNHPKFKMCSTVSKIFDWVTCFNTLHILLQVNTQLYSSKEKNQLSDLVNTMIACNLTYKQEKAPDGQYVYTLEP